MGVDGRSFPHTDALVFVHPHLEAMPDLRHDATLHIVLIYQFDTSVRQSAVARQTQEP